MMQVHPEHSISVEPHPYSASVVQVESSKLLPLVVTLAVFSAFGAALAVWAMVRAQTAERESRMLEYYVLEVDGKLMKSGIIDKGYEAWKREHDK